MGASKAGTTGGAHKTKLGSAGKGSQAGRIRRQGNPGQHLKFTLRVRGRIGFRPLRGTTVAGGIHLSGCSVPFTRGRPLSIPFGLRQTAAHRVAHMTKSAIVPHPRVSIFEFRAQLVKLEDHPVPVRAAVLSCAIQGAFVLGQACDGGMAVGSAGETVKKSFLTGGVQLEQDAGIGSAAA